MSKPHVLSRKRMIQAINEALFEEMTRDEKVILFGQDVEISLFGDTKGLADHFGSNRVRNTPISETVTTGMAVGAAAAGYRVICHMMYGNFIYTGFDAIANQAAKLRYMTNGQLRLPIVFMATFGGGRSQGAQHSDAMHPMLMNLSGIKVATPASPADAKGLLKSAIRDDNPVFFLQSAGRGGELGEVPDCEYTIEFGEAATRCQGDRVTVVAIGAMVKPALRAAHRAEQDGFSVEVIDPRTLVPMDWDTIGASVRKTGHLVVVDEARLTCSAASEIAAWAAENAFSDLKAPVVRVAVPDVPMPYSPPLERFCVPDEDAIHGAIRQVVGWEAR